MKSVSVLDLPANAEVLINLRRLRFFAQVNYDAVKKVLNRVEAEISNTDPSIAMLDSIRLDDEDVQASDLLRNGDTILAKNLSLFGFTHVELIF